MKKRFFSLLTAIGILLSLCPWVAVAGGGEADWIYDPDTGELISSDQSTRLSAWETPDVGSGTLGVDLSGATELDLSGSIEDAEGQSYTITELLTMFSDYSSLVSVVLPGTLKTIPASCFAECENLTSVTLLDGIESIGDAAFFFCKKLTSITLPSTLQRIGSGAFSHCEALTSIDLPDGLQMIGDGAFESCDSLSEIHWPQDGSLTEIGESAFYGCSSLTSLFLQEGVASIGDRAFASTRLRTIALPSTLQEVGSRVFSSLNLNVWVDFTVILRSSSPCAWADDFLPPSTAADFLMVIPEGSKEAYLAADGWNQYAADFQESNVWAFPDSLSLEGVEGYSEPLSGQVTLWSLSDEPQTFQLEPDPWIYYFSDFSVSPATVVVEPHGTAAVTVTVPTGLDYGWWSGILQVKQNEDVKAGAYLDIFIEEGGRSGFDVGFDAGASDVTGWMWTDSNAYTDYTLPENEYYRDGYDFVAWAEDSVEGTQYRPGDSYTVTRDVTFYAVWRERTEYEITPAAGTYDQNKDYYEVTVLRPTGVSLSELKNGDEMLVPQEDYTISGKNVRIFGSYLEQYVGEELTFSFVMDNGDIQTAVVTVPETWTIRILCSPEYTGDCRFTMGTTSFFVEDSCYVPKGESCTLEAVPYFQWEIDCWMVDGEVYSEEAQLELRPESDMTLTMVFQPIEEDMIVDPSYIDFGTVEPGYTAPEAQTVWVWNTSDDLLSLEQPEAAGFEFGTWSMSVLTPGDWASITIQPKEGLPAGNYSAAIQLRADKYPYVPEPRAMSLSVLAEDGSEVLAEDGPEVLTEDQATAALNIHFVVRGGQIAATDFLLSFETNGGSEVDDIAVKMDTEVSLEAYVPAREGYRFAGWYADEALTEPVTALFMDANRTVYAGWDAASEEPSGSAGESGNASEIVTESPATGDSSLLLFWVAAMLLGSSAALASVRKLGKKRR